MLVRNLRTMRVLYWVNVCEISDAGSLRLSVPNLSNGAVYNDLVKQMSL